MRKLALAFLAVALLMAFTMSAMSSQSWAEDKKAPAKKTYQKFGEDKRAVEWKDKKVGDLQAPCQVAHDRPLGLGPSVL